MKSNRLRCFERVVSVAIIVAGGGCAWDEQATPRLSLGVDPSMGPYGDSAAYRDTIGSYSYYEGLTPMRVRGYGLVVGLGKNGSRDCPRHVYDRLVQRLYKRHGFSNAMVGIRSISPEEMINSLDTAVVVVEGEIPPAAVRGTRFDVAVTSLPGTQTRSVRGGRLFATDLEVFRPISAGVSLTGQVLAQAAGPVFLNPFSGPGSATQTSPLKGVLIGGGVVVEDRRVRLVLLEPSYQRARRIQDRLNTRFPGPERVADAISPSLVRLYIPEEFEQDRAHFFSLVRALYLSHDPRFEAIRARALTAELAGPTAPHGQIALALEGLGQAALPAMDALYTHSADHVSFHVAVAGLRLGDHVAGDTMAAHAEDPDCEYRFRAIRGLAKARGMASTAMALRRLLHDGDPRVQIAAYEALLSRYDSAVGSTMIGDDNFLLDQIPTKRSNLIYVKRLGSRRIVLFGGGLRCSPPVLYRSPDGGLTINAHADDEALTLLRVVVESGSMSPPVPCSRDLPALIALLGREAEVAPDGEVVGLGVDYAAVVRALHHLSADRSINARFMLERPSAAEDLGRSRTPGRPESEL